MPQPLTDIGSASLPLENLLALHRALIQARAGSVDLDQFLLAALQTLRVHLRADAALIGLCDTQGARLERFTTHGAISAANVPHDRVSGGPPWRHLDAAEAETFARRWAAQVADYAGLQAVAAAPLPFRGQAIGVVCLFGLSGAAQWQWQQEGLAAVGLEIGMAVEHLRLRRDVEEQLRQRNERWAAIYEMAVSLTRAIDSDELLDQLVRRTVRLLRARGGSLSVTDELTGESVVMIAYLDGAPAERMQGYRMPPGQGLAAEVMASGRTLHIADYEFAAHSALRALRTSVIATPIFVQGAPVGVLAVGDNPETRAFTQDDIQTVELLAQAAGAILERAHGRSQEQSLTLHRERTRLARELHDGLAQNLATLLLKAELCHDMARQSAPELAHRIDLLAEGIQQAVRETRAAIASLHEGGPSGERLMDALALLAARFESQTQVPVALSWEGDAHRALPPAAHMALLRVAQEALANVRKHAGAEKVSIHFNASRPKIVELSVHDDGCGFALESASAIGGQHFGLRGMSGRMEELGGTLRIESMLGCGATITAVLPLLEPVGR